ncbi:MAG: SIR2 family protein [Phycisphaerales bacterium]|nr:SIR2 family protein [Hyphomonadaceae bacterium]
MSDLRFVLSQGRKRIGLLVGAGAPVSILVDKNNRLSSTGAPLIPNVDALTIQVLDTLTGANAKAADALYKELGKETNIESILSRVRLLERAIGSTPVHGLDSGGYAALAQAICAAIGKIVGPSLPTERNSYHELIAWVSGTMRNHAIEIFTTNYDLLFEEAFERARAPYFDGFTGGKSPFFDPVTVAGNDLPSRWSRLWKLHGSLGWTLDGNSIVRSGGRNANELVYPDYLKYDQTQRQPYAALFERLKTFLLTPDTLLLSIGFSFRDAHVSAILDEALAMNSNTAVIAFQYQNLAAEESACRLALDRPNISVYAADGAVISGVAGKWLPGELPKNWAEIRSSFWNLRAPDKPACFILGDFQKFARFCALAQATDLAYSPPNSSVSVEPEPHSESASGMETPASTPDLSVAVSTPTEPTAANDGTDLHAPEAR